MQVQGSQHEADIPRFCGLKRDKLTTVFAFSNGFNPHRQNQIILYQYNQMRLQMQYIAFSIQITKPYNKGFAD